MSKKSNNPTITEQVFNKSITEAADKAIANIAKKNADKKATHEEKAAAAAKGVKSLEKLAAKAKSPAKSEEAKAAKAKSDAEKANKAATTEEKAKVEANKAAAVKAAKIEAKAVEAKAKADALAAKIAAKAKEAAVKANINEEAVKAASEAKTKAAEAKAAKEAAALLIKVGDKVRFNLYRSEDEAEGIVVSLTVFSDTLKPAAYVKVETTEEGKFMKLLKSINTLTVIQESSSK